MSSVESARLLSMFQGAGALLAEADILQPAETLLDLYGEDIRGRAYVTMDPTRGEMMLRPDFTVPVVQMHMREGAEPARYTYAGPVFRKQEEDESRASEFFQVGYELFDGADPAAADAEVFSLMCRALEGLDLRRSIGDIGLLTAAVEGLKTTRARRDALARHIWRPRRFRALLDRYAGRVEMPVSRADLLADMEPMRRVEDVIGKRSVDEIGARISALHQDAAADPISSEEVALIEALLAVTETAPNALSALRDIGVDLPSISPAVERMDARLNAMEGNGVDPNNLMFEGSYGRTSLEYYDGFVFGFYADTRPDLPAIASGGRYDALTKVLGQGRGIPAVGAVIRPDLVEELA